jgi:hypothetical protein
VLTSNSKVKSIDRRNFDTDSLKDVTEYFKKKKEEKALASRQ